MSHPVRRAAAALRVTACTIGAALILAGIPLPAQTRIVAPKNAASPLDDVDLGRKAAADVEKQMPLFHDDAVESYIQALGARLVATIPPEFQHPEFTYTFKVVDVKDINAFALPGGPMYVHRGIIEAAGSEGELAGVMCHELSHVALRHSTAQMTKTKSFGWGQLAGVLAGAAVGGTVGAVISQGTELGMSTAVLRFSRDDEKQADLLGVQLMARAGYDPHDLAHMFETIQKEGGGRPPQWLSDHPNPGNRIEYINREAAMVTVENPVGPADGFVQVQTHLRTLAPAPTLEEIARRNPRR